MKPRRTPMRKVRSDYSEGHKQRLLSERSALILTMALLIAVGAGCLLYAAHQPVVMVVLTTGGVFAGALRLLNDLIG
jgi:hypothetical protein